MQFLLFYIYCFLYYKTFRVCSVKFLPISSIFKISEIQSYFPYGCSDVTKTMFNEAKSIYGDDVLNYISQKLTDYSINSDKTTQDHLNYIYTCLKNLNKYYGYCCPRTFPYLMKAGYFYKYELLHKNLDKYIVEPKFDEIFTGHHGLRFACPEIKEYIKNKDFLDIGAFVGDSAIVLSNYTTKNIYSFEISPFHVEKIKLYSQLNNIEDKVVPINKGVGNEEGFLYISDENINSALTSDINGNIKIEVTTVDNEVYKNLINPGFIKIDTEGCELSILQGAKEVIRKFRPILSIAVYHNFDDLFRIPDFIKTFGNYKIEFRAYSNTAQHMGELILFAYPAEIGDFDSFEVDDAFSVPETPHFYHFY